MRFLNSQKKIISVVIIAVFLAGFVPVPPVYAAEESSSASTAAYALIGTLAAATITFCVAQALGFSFAVQYSSKINCAITNPNGFQLFSSDGVKKWILDPAARMIVRALLQATTRQIVSWIQGDSGKNVGYVANLELALRREADAAGGEFLNNLTGLNLCGNFAAYLNIALRTPGLRQRLECTVTDIVANMNSFYQNFRNGGWPAFVRISLEPQNTLTGAYLIALDAKVEAETRARERVGAGYQIGSGFLGLRIPKKVCTEVAPEIAEAPETRMLEGQGTTVIQKGSGSTSEQVRNAGTGRFEVCQTEYETKTPGQFISSTLNKTLNFGFDFGANAKDFDEAISTIINALLLKAITATFSGDDSETSGEGIFDQSLAQIGIPQEENAGVFVAQVNELVFTADVSMRGIDEGLKITYPNLFKARESAVITPPIEDLITPLEFQVAQLHQAKENVLAVKEQILNFRKTLINAESPVEISRLAMRIPQYAAALRNSTEPVGIIATPPPSTRDVKTDNIQLMQGDLDATRSTLLVMDTIMDEAGRIASTTPSASLKAAAESQKAFLSIEATRLKIAQGRLELARQELAGAVSTSDIKRLSENGISMIFETDLAIRRATNAIKLAGQVIKP